MIVGAITASIFYLFTYGLYRDSVTAMVSSLFMVFSYTFWRYSMEAMPYIFAVSFSVVTLFTAIAILKHPKPHHKIPLTVGLAIASTRPHKF